MTRTVDGVPFNIDVSREDVFVGVKENSDQNQIISQLNILDEDKPEGWSFRRKFNFSNYTSQDLNQAIYNINEAVFNEENPDSLIRKIRVKQ